MQRGGLAHAVGSQDLEHRFPGRYEFPPGLKNQSFAGLERKRRFGRFGRRRRCRRLSEQEEHQ